VEADAGSRDRVRMTCNLLFMCALLQLREWAITPEFAGAQDFTGARSVHPQFWSEDLDYAAALGVSAAAPRR